MREQTCCFSGHRNIPKKDYPQIVSRLEETIRNLVAQGIIYYGAGGALGFDIRAFHGFAIYDNPGIKNSSN